MKKFLHIVFKVAFSRTMIIICLLLFQLLVVLGYMKWLGQYLEVAVGLMLLLGASLLIYIINKDETPEFKLVWVIPICVFPVFGALFYLFIMGNLGGIGLKKELVKKIEETKQYMKTKPEVAAALQAEDDHMYNLSHYLEEVGQFPVFQDCGVEYFKSGEAKFQDMLSEMENAKEFIFLEYFIVERGMMWNRILDVLKKKAAEGVEVRVMYDGMCSLILLPHSYPKKLRAFGIKAKMFSPIIPILSTSQNNRDHRKILVIDGKKAYTGGVNLADEYINEIDKCGHWKDVAVRVDGEAVNSFTVMFLQMWNVGEKTKEDYARYLRDEKPTEGKRAGFVIPYGDGPSNNENLAETVYMDMIHSAKKYVHIMSPYFIVDNAMLDALQFAARRGVDVRLITPHVPDKKTVFAVTRSYYPDLIAAGIKVYEYTPGFVHAKIFVSDDEKAVIGTINMDYRSLFHHFECAAYLFKNETVLEIEKDFMDTVAVSEQVTIEFYRKTPFFFRLMGRVLRLFGPLM